MLYDSDKFVVVHVDLTPGGPKPDSLIEILDAVTGKRMIQPHVAFEIVDKRTNKEVFLSGDWSKVFQRQITAWQDEVPTQEQVEDILDGYCQLAQLPLVVQ